MLVKSVFNDIQNIIMNNSRSRNENCTLNTQIVNGCMVGKKKSRKFHFL